MGRLLALPATIRLGWKGLPGTNTLAYYKARVFVPGKRFQPSLMCGGKVRSYPSIVPERSYTRVASGLTRNH
jgi:hypothetical protein